MIKIISPIMAASLPVQVATGMLCASYWRGAWYVLDHTMFPDDRLTSGTVSLACGSTLLAMQQYMLSPSYNGTKQLVRLLPPPKNVSLRTRYLQTNRFIMLYGIASACILIWRGTWLLWDEGAHQICDAYAESRLQKQVEDAKDGLGRMRRQLTNLGGNQQHHDHEGHHGESSVTNHEDIDEKILFYSGIASHVVATVGLLCMGRFASVMAPPANVSMVRDLFIHGKGKQFMRASRSFTHGQ